MQSKNPATMNTRPPSPPAYQPPPQVYTGGGIGGPTPPSLIHRSNISSYSSLIPPIAQAHLSPPTSSPFVDGPPRQMASVSNAVIRNSTQPQQRVMYPPSPTTADLWSGNKMPPGMQTQTHASSTSR